MKLTEVSSNLLYECWAYGNHITPYQKRHTVLKKYEYHEEKIVFPEEVMYKDTLCLFPQESVTLDKWALSKSAFDTLKQDFPKYLKSLSLNKAQGVTSSRLEMIPSLKNINILHLKGVLTIDVSTASLIGRLSQVYELDISENTVLEKSFHHIFSRLEMLKYLYCNKCKGIDDFALQTVANSVSKFRKLSHIYLAENHDFSDEGVLALVTVGPNVIIDLDISGSNSLTTLSMAGVRRHMSSLRVLNISCVRGSGQSAYEFIAEGCVFLTDLDIHKSATLNDAALVLIGRKCALLRKLNVSDCVNITDVGVEGFTKEFQGQLECINISGCVKCGGGAAFALSTASQHLTSISMNCLSMVTKASMQALWKKLPVLEEFEMSADIRSSGTHRRSMIPHISDDVVMSCKMRRLRYIKVCGACQITDVGACFLARYSKLTKVDFSHCNAITDKLLVSLGKYAPELKHVIIVGLGFVTDIGIKALCIGCPDIVTLDCNGCSGINDFGAAEIRNLTKLETLNLSSCDFVTDEAVVEIARGCRELRCVSLNNMDMVTKASVACLARYCTKLVRLSCLICNIVPDEFQQCCKYLPMSKALAKCQLGSRSPAVVAYNQYVDSFNKKSLQCVQLQKYLRGWMASLKHKRHVSLRAASALTMQRFYRGCRGRESVSAAKAARRKLHKDARRLQKVMRRLKARRFNRWKMFFRIKQYRATILLQRCARGYLCRNRNHYRAKRLGGKKARIFHLAQLYRVILEARSVHRKITMVQAITRGRIQRKRFKRAMRGIRKFMRLCNVHLSAQHAMDLIADELVLHHAEREQAGFNIATWAAAIIHNRLIVDFTMECAIWYRNDADTSQWVKENRRVAAIVIQARVRGRQTRRRLAAEKREREEGYASAVVITRNMQRYVATKRFRVWRPHMKRISGLWRRLYKAGMHFYYSHFAKVIQRNFRLCKFLRDRKAAATTINRVARGRLGRIRAKKRMEEVQWDYCIIVQRKFRAHRRKKQRYFEYCRRFLAARRIQCAARRYIKQEQEKRTLAEQRLAAYAKQQEEKLAIVNKKKLKILDKIKNTSRNRYASKIQRSWRKYIKAKKAKHEAEESRKQVMADLLAESNREKEGFLLGSLIPNPKKALKNAARKLGKLLKEEKISDEDKPLYMVSVMKYQTQSITQVGIIDIALTFGEGETSAFALQQDFLRSTKKRFFIIVEGDLSGHLGLCMRLWVMKGSGNECICKLSVKNKPKGSSIAAIRNRVAQRRIDGINIAWNERVHIEIHGACSLKRQESGFAVDALRICHNSDDATDARDDGFHLVADLAEFSLPSSLWFHGKTHAPDEGVFKLSVLETQDWYDERLRKCCLKFNLSEADVFQMRSTFDAISKESYSFEIKTHDMFRYFNLPITHVAMWLVEAIEPRDPNSITFSEYVHLISFFSVFGEQEKLRFLFGRNCTKSHQTMTKAQFETTLEFLTQGFTGQKNMVKWTRAFDTYCNQKLKLMFFSEFEKFFRTNSRACWAVNEIQLAFMENNIGRNYWVTKCQNFTYIRKGLGFVST